MNMRVYYLSVGMSYPPKTGGGLRCANLLKLLRQCGHVTLVCLRTGCDFNPKVAKGIIYDDLLLLDGPAYVPDATTSSLVNVARDLLDVRPRQFRYLDSPEIRKLLANLSRQKGCVIWGEPEWMSFHFPKYAGKGGCFVSDWDDVESSRMQMSRLPSPASIRGLLQSLLGIINHWKICYYEYRVLKSGCAVICASSDDSEVLRSRDNRSALYYIPNGVPFIGRKCPDEPYSVSARLLLPGALNYSPNQDAALWFVGEIFPIIRKHIDAELVIAGRSPSEAVRNLGNLPGVQVVADPANMAQLFNSASVVVVPIRAGCGTRIKILEAYNHGRCVVSTHFGAYGLTFEDGEEILLRDSAADFAQACIDLVSDTQLRRRLAVNGWRRVQSKYLWDSFLPVLQEMLECEIHKQCV
jgi:glycosyltransferase involved in cell wall biosynthesis